MKLQLEGLPVTTKLERFITFRFVSVMYHHKSIQTILQFTPVSVQIHTDFNKNVDSAVQLVHLCRAVRHNQVY